MGLFDKILQGLGFEPEHTIEKPIKKENLKKENSVKVKHKFTLKKTSKNKFQNFEFYPQSQQDIADLIIKIKQGINATINFSNMQNEELIKSIAFFNGACYALNITPIYLDNKIFQINSLNEEIDIEKPCV